MSDLKAFRNKPIPRGSEGDKRRIELAATRCKRVLTSTVAQDERCIRMGMQMKINMIPNEETGTNSIDLNFGSGLMDEELMEIALTRARPFMLGSENIYYVRVLESLRRGTQDKHLLEQCDNLQYAFEQVPFNRMQFFVADTETHTKLIPDGVTNAVVADRYNYSELAHADDAEDVLKHIKQPMKLFSLASSVADHIAVLAALESLIHRIFPDVCPELTSWAGSPETVNLRRWGKERLDG